MYRFDTNGQMTMLDLDTAERGGAPPKRRPGKPDSELVSIPYFHLDLLSSPVDLFGQRHWELRSPWREGKRPLNTGAAPRRPIRVSLSGILEAYPSLKYYLSKTACLGILRRAFERGKKLPKMLARALKIQAGLMKPDSQPTDLKAFHVNQRNEGIDLNGVSGALMATTNMQMQTFVTQPNGAAEGFDGYNGIMAFAATVVGVVCHKDEGLFFHIGDGAALAFTSSDLSSYVASKPENGVFACETYFYTMDDWQESLRFTAFKEAHTVMLMSDGLTNFSFAPDFSRIEPNFLLPINDFLNREKQQVRAVRALTNTLNTTRAKRLNPDDKTFLWARL